MDFIFMSEDEIILVAGLNTYFDRLIHHYLKE
jgi:hypothetical protein